MIRLEIVCDHAEEPRARDVKAPCDSTRNKSLCVDIAGAMSELIRAVDREITRRGWHRWIIPAYGRKKGYICGNCYKRAKGQI